MAVAVYTPANALTSPDVNQQINFRVLVKMAAASNGQLRVTFRTGGGGSGLGIEGASVGKWDGLILTSAACDMTTPPHRLMFAGLVEKLIPANSTFTTDWVTHSNFALAAGDWLIVSFKINYDGYEVYSTGPTNTDVATAFKATSTDYSQAQTALEMGNGISITGGKQPGEAGGYNFSVDLVETNDPSGGDSGSGKAKVWAGSAWAKKPAKVWTGSAWVAKPVKFWTGSAWVPTKGDTAGPPVTTGLEVWLDASTLALADGAEVTAWPNLGSGVAPVIESWLVPINYKTNQVGDKGVVRFNGGGTSSHIHGVTTATHDFTVLYVTRRWGPVVGRAFSTKYPPTNVLVGFHSTGQDVAYDGGNWMVGATAWGGYPDAWKLYGLDGVSPSTMRFYVNGIVKGTSPSGQGLGGGYVLSSYRGDSQTDETMDCDIAEVLIYTRQLTDPERVSVENYLRAKWGLT